MRSLLLLSMLTFAACNSNGATDTMDMTAAPPDLSSAADLAKPDLSAGKLTCGGIISCFMGCTSQQCFTDCYTRGTTQAQGKLQSLFLCGVDACSTPDDGGVASCSGPTDQTPECQQCALGAIMGGSCPNETAACTNDTM
jgi:hypothetical protein